MAKDDKNIQSSRHTTQRSSSEAWQQVNIFSGGSNVRKWWCHISSFHLGQIFFSISLEKIGFFSSTSLAPSHSLSQTHHCYTHSISHTHTCLSLSLSLCLPIFSEQTKYNYKLKLSFQRKLDEQTNVQFTFLLEKSLRKCFEINCLKMCLRKWYFSVKIKFCSIR